MFSDNQGDHLPTTKPVIKGNQLLAALPSRDRGRVLAGCELVELKFAQILSEPGERIQQVYFPMESFISLTKPLSDSSSLEVGLVGDEGMHGIALILGVGISPLHAVVQGEGSALRINATTFRRELAQSPSLQRILKRYFYVLFCQIAQTAACTRYHVVEARLARWLLMTQDRAHSNTFYVTQVFLAYMLGVRRVGVTRAATALQNRKLISYTRGNIRILDRSGLESAACECYAADKASYATIMDPVSVDLS